MGICLAQGGSMASFGDLKGHVLGGTADRRPCKGEEKNKLQRSTKAILLIHERREVKMRPINGFEITLACIYLVF